MNINEMVDIGTKESNEISTYISKKHKVNQYSNVFFPEVGDELPIPEDIERLHGDEWVLPGMKVKFIYVNIEIGKGPDSYVVLYSKKWFPD